MSNRTRARTRLTQRAHRRRTALLRIRSVAAPGTTEARRRRPTSVFARGPRLPWSESGQSLVEFALIFPLFIILVMSVIEFALAFNAILGVNRASEQAVQVASEAGNDPAADCYILQAVEQAIQVPNSESNIVHVQIQWTNPSGGTVNAMDEYDRSGSTSCTTSTGTSINVPYTATANGYGPAQRCNVINGCPAISSAHNTVDTIGVTVRYQYTWKTPIGSLLRFIGGSNTWGSGMTFNKRNVMRIEPIL
jgi:Flp pilus assembly protein TadG